jgi:signal transduction histidine kinase
LRNISGFAELLRKRTGAGLDEESERFLGIVGSEAVRLGQLIDSLLVFSRLARSELKRQPLDLANLIQAVQQELAPEVDGRAVEWRLGPMPEVPADATLLRQVFANLLGNAVKFTRHRDVAVIEITARTWNGAIPEHVIAVRDNGVGFDPKYTDKLFGVFQRLHNSRDYAGSGIGLATVRRIVARHGGRVWAEGQTGIGATFTFTLPVRPPGAAGTNPDAA